MCHVLIIEDEVLVAMDIRGLLADEGATSFDLAETQAEAIAMALSHRPDLITSDVNLRQGTGPLAVHEIFEVLGAVPVIFITGSPDDCRPCDAGATVLTKPLQDQAVTAAFRDLAIV